MATKLYRVGRKESDKRKPEAVFVGFVLETGPTSKLAQSHSLASLHRSPCEALCTK